MPHVFFAISTQHLIRAGGIGSFFKGFARMADSFGWQLTCILDKKPTGASKQMMNLVDSCTYVWPKNAVSYAKPPGSHRYDVKEKVDPKKIANFRASFELALASGTPDLVLINTPEAVDAVDEVPSATTVLFYTHHENLFQRGKKKGWDKFDTSYDDFLREVVSRPSITVATQSRGNLERLQALNLSSPAVVLPMPVPDDEMLAIRQGRSCAQPEGVLFIGRHEGRKAPEIFAQKIAKADLPARVLTNKRGVASFKRTFAKWGVSNYQIEADLSGKAKADFIASAKVAFHPSWSESYGFCAMETLIAGLPTLCIHERGWWTNFEDHGVEVAPIRRSHEKLLQLYQRGSTVVGQWQAREKLTFEAWREFMATRTSAANSTAAAPDPEPKDTACSENLLNAKTSESPRREPGRIYEDEIEEWANFQVVDPKHIKPQPIDYSASPMFQDNAALYTPALSEAFVQTLQRANPNICNGFSNVDLQITNPKSRLFFYPWVLYSAGQAASTKAKAARKDWLTVKPRDPRVVVLGDSGGYQVQQGTIDFTPATPGAILSWLEAVADYSMTLDFPVGGIPTGALTKHIECLNQEGYDVEAQAQQNGFSADYMACLLQTERNNQEFTTSRTVGATKFLNVIQGRNERESCFWYEYMKGFEFEGWAFAGKHHTQLSLTLMRLADMERDGILKACQRIHFLGISTLRAGLVLTCLQRALRQTGVAPDVQITFDSATPVKHAANAYQAILGFDTEGDKWSFKPHRVPAELLLNKGRTIGDLSREWVKGSSTRRRISTFVGETVSFKQLVTRRDGDLSTLSGEQFALLVHHNTQAYIEGFRQAYRYLNRANELQLPPVVRDLQSMFDWIFSRKIEDRHATVSEFTVALDQLMHEQI